MNPLHRIFVFAAAAALFSTAATATCTQSNPSTGAQLDGAIYVVSMPEMSCWNGDIVVFAHGYVQPGPVTGYPVDQLTVGGIYLPATFNALGYGFAASSYDKNGLAILQGLSDTEDLVQNILKPTLRPRRIYLIGASEGGLVTALSAEQLPGVYNAAGAACGPIGSFQDQINYFGDFRVIFDYFFPDVIPGSPISIPSEVMTDWPAYIIKIENALAANPSAAQQLIRVTHAPVTSDPATIAETTIGILWYNVFATNDAKATVNGQPYDNHNRIYLGSNNDFLLNLKVARFKASAPGLLSAYETTGRLTMPMVTLHTTLDPIIPYWHEPLYTLKTLFDGTLLQLTPIPVSAYGHCNFSAGNVLGAFTIIVLRDSGANLSTILESLLPPSALADFEAALKQIGL